MSSIRKRNALHGYAPSADATKTKTCTGSNGKKYTVTDGATMNFGGNMKFGLYPTVGKSIGFLNLLSSCCRNKNVVYKGVVIDTKC